jgi:phosphoribosyl 1,2-cyclic phosphodiesterase
MSLYFKSLLSSSSGNCLMLWTDHTTILLDCGINTQYVCRDLLDQHFGLFQKPHAVLISHAHGDHICYASLRVLAGQGIPLHCHAGTVQQIHDKHIGDWDSPPTLQTFARGHFRIGDLEIQPVELPHDPEFLTCGFVVRSGQTKAVIATDFHDADAVAEHLPDADFIFIEANHDLDLQPVSPEQSQDRPAPLPRPQKP